jgi:hypothetical protein
VRYCPENSPKREGLYSELYDTPWQEQGRSVWFCSDECEQAYCFSGDFEYPTCEACQRQVCTQNPANGWHVQYRSHADLGEVCLRCYQEEILKNGQPRSDFEDEEIGGGMFFSWGNREAKAAGFEEVDPFRDFHVANLNSVRRYNSHALWLIEGGAQVMTAYERMAIGGLEGYVTMLARQGLNGPNGRHSAQGLGSRPGSSG